MSFLTRLTARIVASTSQCASFPCAGAVRSIGTTASSSHAAHGLDAFVDANRDDKTFVGREWRAEELRRKSFKDLHELWYVLLTERNMLLTEKHLAKVNREPMRAPHRMTKVRKSMAKIKLVLTERAIEEAGDDAQKLFEFKRLINAK
jgi:large subunit ribosomal protein L47|mmetsp:Transcript_9068/g.29888  ORF Transcript_9068/g.29888 Transcript_9068/m.29888 type:complete len:148 (-) Transcript_9068:1066-1509(-)